MKQRADYTKKVFAFIKEKHRTIFILLFCVSLVFFIASVVASPISSLPPYVVPILVIVGIMFSAAAVLFQLYLNSRDYVAVMSIDWISMHGNWDKFATDADALFTAADNRQYAMIVFDIDRFKAINDIFGHDGGNEYLMYISSLLKSKLQGSKGLFVRALADRFNVIIPYTGNEGIIKFINEFTSDAETYFDGYTVSFCFGVYVIEDLGMSLSVMSDRATIARDTVKNMAFNKIAFFNNEMRCKLLLENEIQNTMELALNENRFEIYIQPVYLFETGRIIGGEALVRWNRKGQDMFYPDNFIPLFEKNGFIKRIDYYVFEEVCRIISRWKKTGGVMADLMISVNLSRVHIYNRTLTDDLVAIAQKYKVNPYEIEIEITESSVADDQFLMEAMITALKTAGFIIAIDDFGSGFSSLNILRRLNVDVLKLDREFLSAFADDERSKLIIKHLISMPQDIGLCVVAEGVEEESQVEFLKDVGCDIAQGFYYSKAVPLNEYEKLAVEQG